MVLPSQCPPWERRTGPARKPVTTLCLHANGHARDRLPPAYFADPAYLGARPEGLHDSEIRCGVQNEPPAGGITAWIDFGSRTEKATFYETIVGDRQVWPAVDRMAAWLHKTALRLFPESPCAEEHSTGGSSRPSR